MPRQQALSLEELAAMREESQEPPTDEEALSAHVARATQQAEQEVPARTTRRRGGITGANLDGTPASDDSATTSESRVAGVTVTEQDQTFVVQDSDGTTIQIDVPAGSRVNIAHDHSGEVRRPSCAVCMAFWEHERSLIRAKREQDNPTTPAFRTVGEEGEDFGFVDDREEAVTVRLEPGSRVTVREGHEHDGRRRPNCAACMAISDHNRSLRPATTPATPRPCLCECGGETKGGRFVPGHDARLYGRIIRYLDWQEDNLLKPEAEREDPSAYVTAIGSALPASVIEAGPESFLPESYRTRRAANR